MHISSDFLQGQRKQIITEYYLLIVNKLLAKIRGQLKLAKSGILALFNKKHRKFAAKISAHVAYYRRSY
jgi:hypothetical protein